MYLMVMENFQSFYQNVITHSSDRLRKLIRPLQQPFHLDYFSFQRVDLSGKYTFISNRPDYIQFYMEKQLYQLDPYLVHPKYYSQDTEIIPVFKAELQEDNTSLHQLLSECGKYFGFSQSILITKKKSNYYETFCFSTKLKDPKQVSFYLRERFIFENFIEHFYDEIGTEYLDAISTQGMDLEAAKGNPFHSPDSELNSTFFLTDEIRENLIAQFNPEQGRFLRGLKDLTERERACLNWMLQGKTSWETGIILRISKRTVEKHLENVFRKLDGPANKARIAYMAGKLR